MSKAEYDFERFKVLYKHRGEAEFKAIQEDQRLQTALKQYIGTEVLTQINEDPEIETKIMPFLIFIQRQTLMNYYLMAINRDDGGFSLLRSDFTFMASISTCLANKLTAPHVSSKRIIELKSIMSLRYRNAYKFMSRLIKLAEEIDCPITLWTETDRPTEYFTRYGFKDCGKIGYNGERLMVLNPGEGSI